MTAFDNLRQRPDHIRFIGPRLTDIWVIPFTQHSQTFETITLQVDLLIRIFTTLLSKGAGINLSPDFSNLLFDL